MKKSEQKSANVRTGRLDSRTCSFAYVLFAGFVFTVPVLAAPLPTPCAGACGPSANLPFVQAGTVAAPVISGNTMTINQSSPTAILNWQNFNIGNGNSVNFVQPNSMASTLNKIWDTSASTIAGSLTANGQIYLINHNGIVFGNGAQVNTGALVASSLDIDDTLFQAGYLTNTQVLPAFSGIGGFIRVDTGAVLNGSRIMLFAPVVENSGSISTPGGQTVLAAGHKVYLEASQDPNLRGVLVEVDVNNPGVADPLLAGNGLQHTEAGTVSNFAGTLKSGILAERGNITLAGFAVNQQGRVSATTSVTENGSIKLLARYNVATDLNTTWNQSANSNGNSSVYDIRATQTGKVTLAAGSVTQVVPELADTSTNTDGQGFNPSIIEAMGNTINMQSGSSIVAPGGKVTLAAVSSYVPATLTTPATGLNPAVGNNGESGIGAYQEINKALPYSSFFNPNYKPISATTDAARVFMDSGSIIDVSGSQASVSVARNILTVQLRGSQLQDAPLQRVNRFLWGKDVLVDIRKGTPLANYAGEEAQIARTVAERTATGGTVKLVSTGDVVMKNGAKIDLSGGQINYTGANINTTMLVSDGVTYDIAAASPDRIYTGVFNNYTTVDHKKWGVTETFSTLAGGDIRGRWDPGYIEGKSAGILTVLAPHAVVNGDLLAKTVAGSYQRLPFADPGTLAANNYKNTWQLRPQGGSLVIGDSKATADLLGVTNYITDSDVILQAKPMQLDNAFALFDPINKNVAALPANFLQGIGLDANLFSAATGLNRLEIFSNRTVSVASGTSIQLAGGGKIALQGNAVNMMGAIDAPSGMIKMGTSITAASAGTKAGALSVGSTGMSSYISTRGQWVNDGLQSGVPDFSKPLSINGGNITLSSGADLLVAAGTLLDASGGAWLDSSNKYHGGNGGAITLANGGVNGATNNAFLAQLDGLDLRSYGTAGGKGGALTIKAGDIMLGSMSMNNALTLPSSSFQKGGFGSYNLSAQGLNGLTVSAGTVIEPKVQSLILDSTAAQQKSGADVNTFAQIGMLPDWQRYSASIALSQSNALGTLKVDANAIVRVEPTASINLNATNQLTMLGSLEAPGGSINLDLNSKGTAYVSTQSIWLGSQSKLLSQGYFLKAQPNVQNLTQGQVLAGGKINISTNTGYVVAQQGSLMDVSGTSANLDLPQLLSGSLVYRNSHIAGDAGSISVQAGEGALFDGNMNAGVEAGSQAAGGKFSLVLNNDPELGAPSGNSGGYPMVPPQIKVMAGGNGGFATQAGLKPGNDANAGLAALTALAGNALLDAGALQKSGFDQITLKSDNTIMLADQATLQARRSVMLDALQLAASGNSTLSSAHVTLANTNSSFQNAPNPGGGTGALNVSGQLVDLTGNFTVSGASQLFIASSGDIRLNGITDSTHTSLQGSLRTQGNMSLQADQIYPSTLAQFKLSVENSSGGPAGKITVLPGQHSPGAVMSAGGQLTLSAADILQNGAVKAPLGTLNLNGSQSVTLGAGSLTLVSTGGLTIPFGLVEGGNTWRYDLNGAGNLVTVATPPQKQINLAGINVAINSAQNGKPAAVLDLSGGGDLYAYEFFAGSGGSVNVLDPAKAPANTFAILPGYSGYAPYDPQYAGQYAQSGSKTILQSGGSVYLSGGIGVQAGYYTLLPASYALLPGAYRVTAVAGYGDRQPGQGVTTLLDGTQIMAGKIAAVGTAIQDARFSGFAVTPGSVVRTQSEYHDSYANAFFTTQASTNSTSVPRLPVDAGQLIVSAAGTGATLALDGSFNAVPGIISPSATGRGALVDLNGPGFAIVNTKSPASGLVQLTTDSLNKLGADSLLIGGVRSQDATGMNIAVGASQVVVDNGGSVLAGPEIILAAGNAVTVRAGSDIEGKGVSVGQSSNIDIGSASANGDGALLRVSTTPQVTVARTNLAAVPVQSTLTVENGATVGAQNAVLLDSSYASTIVSNAVLKGQTLSIAAQGIEVGRNPTPAVTSLSLSGALLTQALTFKDLTLHSYNDINFYGTASLGGLDANQQHILNNLVLNTRSLNGLNNAGLTNVIDAANVMLLNNKNGTSISTAYGAGNLRINADQIVLSDGNKSIQGFDTVTFAAAKRIVGQGTGNVTVNAGDANVHNLLLQAGQITGTNRSNLTITAANDVISMQPATAVSPAVAEALNAKLTIVGKSIADNGVINLLSGSVNLHATGAAATDGVALGNGSRTVVAGVSKNIAGQTAYAQAGSIALTADNGGVDIQGGAVVDVSGTAGGGDAGSINIAAAKGAVAVAGNLKGAAAPGYVTGSFILDASSLNNPAGGAGNALTGLNDTLTAGGFTTLRDMRVRTGNLAIDADVAGAKTFRASAQTFRLAADAGNIDVYGTVDASGANGGNILLAAKNNLTLNAGALLDAHATGVGQAGGKVTLETATGSIELNNQQIDVHGSGNTGGSVLLRAPRNVANTDVAVNNTGGTKLNVSAGAGVTVEAFKTYAAPASLAAADVAATSVYYTDATSFASNAATVKARLGMMSNPNLHLTPGVELSTAGDLVLAANWDLSTWRFDDGNGGITEPGILTLRAGNNLNFTGSATTLASLTDGFTTAIPTNNATVKVGFKAVAATPADNNGISVSKGIFPVLIPSTTASWSYRLVAGADTGSADVMAVNNTVPMNTGNVVLVAGTEKTTGIGAAAKYTYTMEQIRTGTGFIDIAAGGNLSLGNRDSVIYTAGQLAAGIPVTGTNYHFGVNGGDINIRVKGDVIGAPTDQLITDWQWRQGAINASGTITTQPAWWTNLGSFRQNIGALGGGNVFVSAGGNINNLSAVAPTTGYVDLVNPAHPNVVLGGGNISITAGGDINSGVFYTGNGLGSIQAGGNLGTSRWDINNVPLYTVLALGQGHYDVRTGGALHLQSVLNPTAISQGYSQNPPLVFNKPTSFYFTYGDTSGVALSSRSSDVVLHNYPGLFYSSVGQAGFFYLNSGNQGDAATTVYPGSLQVTAMDGSIINNFYPTLFPSASGSLKFIAAKDIGLTGGQIIMSDAAAGSFQASSPSIRGDKLVLPLASGLSSLHAQDVQPVIMSAGGSIGNGYMVLPKSAYVQAGLDVQNLALSVQNLNSTDTTSIVAGRDIVYTTDPNNPSLVPVGITVAGPGHVMLQAGHNVDLGQSTGVMTTGNLANLLLPEQGADVTVLAGVGQGATAAQSFIDKYINPVAGKSYGADLIAYVGSYGAPQNQTTDQAYAYFITLSKPLQDAFVRQVLFSELRQSGRSATGKGGYQRGFDAIAALFPATGYQGDINLYYSQIKTMRGGGIDLLAPGGGVNAGLANPSATGPQKSASQLGIVTVKGGDVNAFVNNDFMVNQSRVFTLQGGNILMWSSAGNIDAGKGSKSVSSTPPPLLVVDPKTGAFNVDVTQSVVGSGIRVLLANKNVVPGSVDLFAPSGEINAGDAGIGAAGNIFLGALRVVGADNINFGGTSVGVPLAAPAPVHIGGFGNMQDAAAAAEQATQNMNNASEMAKKSLANFRPTFLSVEVIGLGNESMSLQQ